MPVIDDTIHTLEIKKFKEEVKEQIDALIKRIEALEGKKGGK